jgi:hypothetical protein
VVHDIEIMGDMIYIPEEPIEEEVPVPTDPDKETSPESSEEEILQGLVDAIIMAEDASKVESLIDPEESILVSDFAVKVYPNPTTDMVTVWVEKPGTHQLAVKLVDVDGKLVYEGQWVAFMENRQRISMAQLPAGVYILQLGAGQEKVTRRILKI